MEAHGVDHWTLVGEKLTAEKRLAEDAKKASHTLYKVPLQEVAEGRNLIVQQIARIVQSRLRFKGSERKRHTGTAFKTGQNSQGFSRVMTRPVGRVGRFSKRHGSDQVKSRGLEPHGSDRCGLGRDLS